MVLFNFQQKVKLNLTSLDLLVLVPLARLPSCSGEAACCSYEMLGVRTRKEAVERRLLEVFKIPNATCAI